MNINFIISSTILVIVGIILYAVSPILLPFVLGMSLAYFLNPVVTKLDDLGCPRALASFAPVLIFFMAIIVIFLALLPVIAEDFANFASKVPAYMIWIEEMVHPQGDLATFLAGYGIHLEALISHETLTEYADYITAATLKTLKGIALSTLAIGEFVSLMIITPLVVFYLLNDWPSFAKKAKDLIPAKQRSNVVKTWSEMDMMLAKFMRGQVMVSISLGIFYGIGLSVVGLQMGFIIGFAAGLLSFIPYVGMLVGLSTATAVAGLQFQFGSIDPFLMVASVFIAGQILEGFYLTPKLVGKEVGLHPVWVIFAVMAGGHLGGFLGVLLALPAASVLTVLVPKALELWHKSTSGKR